jgi:hypothetical protein
MANNGEKVIIPSDEVENFKFAYSIDGQLEEFQIPLIEHLPVNLAKQLITEDAQNTSKLFDLLGEILDKYAPELSKHLTIKQLTFLLEQWSEKSNVSLGE